MSLRDQLREYWRGLKAETFGLFYKDLSSILSNANPNVELGTRIQWIEDLLDWIRIPVSPGPERSVAQIQAVRVKFLLQVLDRNPAWKRAASDLIVSVLLETNSLTLMCETGLHRGSGFFGEAIERFMHRYLPAPRNERELEELFARLFVDETDADWLQSLDESTLESIQNFIFQNENVREVLARRYRESMLEAFIVLASHAESLGLSSDIRLRSQVIHVRDSAFFRLRMAAAEAYSVFAQGDGSVDHIPAERFAPHFSACRAEVRSALNHLEEHGVSVTIVYRLEMLERFLARMEALANILFANPSHSRSTLWLKLLADLVRSRLESTQIKSLIQENMHMLARKIVERAGVSGEHYITQTKAEYWKMLRSACGGGVLTAGTAYLKYLTTKASPAPFFEGFFSWINYSGSFLLMQTFHFTLATKQPSMTAPALAAKIDELKQKSDLHEFADLVARITRSQFAAALGNVGAVIPVTFLGSLLYFHLFETPIMSEEYARKTIESLHPWKSLTIFYAFLTGLILWVSSIGAGWIENWFVYRRLPETIRQSPLLKGFFGEKRAPKIADWLCKNISGVGGSICLGFLLAFTPLLGRFFGLPIDVRHVTLSAGALTYAFSSLPWESVHLSMIAWGALSILLIGGFNFGISFIAALLTAIKARQVHRARIALFRAATWTRFLAAPSVFFFPKDSK